jgi:hypothetical protein
MVGQCRLTTTSNGDGPGGKVSFWAIESMLKKQRQNAIMVILGISDKGDTY